MATNGHKECYGKMFPDALHFRSDEPVRGKAFWYELDTACGVSRADRSTGVNESAWDDCRLCPEFEACYKLGLGKLALQAVIANE